MGPVKALAIAVAALALAPSAVAAPLAVRASVDVRTPAFGAAVHTRVTVTVDSRLARPETVKVVDDVTPLTTVGRPTTSRRGDTIVIERTAACLDAPCVGATRSTTVSLPNVRVTATATDGRVLHATVAWPRLAVHGRVTRADLARQRPPFHTDTSPRPVSYRIAPSTLAWLLDAGAALLGLAAIALGAHTIRAFARRRRAARPVDELALALRLAREAETRPVPDRRRALGLVARLLGDRDLARRTSGLAWSRPAPQPRELAAIVDAAEREVDG